MKAVSRPPWTSGMRERTGGAIGPVRARTCHLRGSPRNAQERRPGHRWAADYQARGSGRRQPPERTMHHSVPGSRSATHAVRPLHRSTLACPSLPYRSAARRPNLGVSWAAPRCWSCHHRHRRGSSVPDCCLAGRVDGVVRSRRDVCSTRPAERAFATPRYRGLHGRGAHDGEHGFSLRSR